MDMTPLVQDQGMASVTLPPEGLDTEATARRLEAQVAETVGRINQGHVELVAIAAEAKATGAWAGPGLRSLGHWLTWQAGV